MHNKVFRGKAVEYGINKIIFHSPVEVKSEDF